MSKVIVVGGGAAGMMAAVFAAENGHHVQIYEKNDLPQSLVRSRCAD